MALFPRMGTIAAADLEPQFQGLKGKDGSPAKEFVFNKGL